ncbi:endonuclease/exonuclease/phosphatase family protein, partial [Trifolium medium]|nr:endonuclease/exonuclease/phosphatase family protein [Trifolium medium]
MAQLMGLSDHCPLLLLVDEENWGPRPVRMLKCWHDIPGFKQFVIDKWRSLQIDGNIPGRIDNLKARLSVLYGRGEEEVLNDDEVAELRGITSDIHSLSCVNTSICWQQSRLLWLREGDVNSKYFHSVLSSRRRQNALSVIMVN